MTVLDDMRRRIGSKYGLTAHLIGLMRGVTPETIEEEAIMLKQTMPIPGGNGENLFDRIRREEREIQARTAGCNMETVLARLEKSGSMPR